MYLPVQQREFRIESLFPNSQRIFVTALSTMKFRHRCRLSKASEFLGVEWKQGQLGRVHVAYPGKRFPKVPFSKTSHHRSPLICHQPRHPFSSCPFLQATQVYTSSSFSLTTLQFTSRARYIVTLLLRRSRNHLVIRSSYLKVEHPRECVTIIPRGNFVTAISRRYIRTRIRTREKLVLEEFFMLEIFLLKNHISQELLE